MNRVFHVLELHRPIRARDLAPGGTEVPAADGTVSIREYRSLVGPKELEPDPARHLAGGSDAASIEPGLYLFTQGSSGAKGRPDDAEIRDDAEAMWLESLWRDLEFKNDRILVRILSEDGAFVYQLFREITGSVGRCAYSRSVSTMKRSELPRFSASSFSITKTMDFPDWSVMILRIW